MLEKFLSQFQLWALECYTERSRKLCQGIENNRILMIVRCSSLVTDYKVKKVLFRAQIGLRRFWSCGPFLFHHAVLMASIKE